MSEKKINIAIDGPAGAGKSTIAKGASEKLGFIYVDTGALYRSIAYYVLKNGKDASLESDVIPLLDKISIELKFIDGEQRVFVNDEDVSDMIRTLEVTMGSSAVSAIPKVREFLFELQKDIAKGNNVIMDGRDIGTVVLPNADLKIFITATPEERARRRYNEMKDKENPPSYEKILADIRIRDYNDSNRAVAPLKQAEDAILFDTTGLGLEDSVNKVVGMVMKIGNQ